MSSDSRNRMAFFMLSYNKINEEKLYCDEWSSINYARSKTFLLIY